MKNKIYTVLVVVFALICAVQAFALPDIPPTCSLSSNTGDADTTAVLTAVSTDSLGNAGVSSIRIYEDGSRISTKDCNGATSCVSVKTVTHMSGGERTYHAVCRDVSGQSTTSADVEVDFDGGNHDPEITSKTPEGPVEILENETVMLEVDAEDEDGDSLSYSWSVDQMFIIFYSEPYLEFSRNVDGDSRDFDVGVSVTDGVGGYDGTSWDVTIVDLEPEVTITGDSGLTECERFDFDANIDSYDDIVSIVWDFGDGANHTGNASAASVQHTFDGDGDYTVTVTVEDADGDTASDSFEVEVLDIAPQDLSFTWDPASPFEGDLVSFTAEASMECGADSIDSWSWDFDDDGESDADGQSADHAFGQEGTYPVTLTVADDDGSEESLTLDVVVADLGPGASFTWDPAGPIEGDEIDFTDASTSHDGITGWSWDFDGDGIEDSDEQDPSWTFGVEGAHQVCLTVSEDDGSEDTACDDVLVGNNVPEVLLEADDAEGPEPHDVHFTCSVTGGGNAPFGFEIDFGDGSPAVQDSEADHTYAQDGVYTATCIVTDADGDQGTASLDIEVDNVVPDVELILNVTDGEEPLDVHADCFAYDGNEPYQNFEIDFGDGIAVNAESADHTYDQDGAYDVTCTVTDADGDDGQDTVAVNVTDTVPEVDFTRDPEFPNEGEQVDFDADMDAYDGIADIDWDFDDGGSDDVEDPSHVFADGGDYTVTLTVTDSDGSEVSVSHDVHVVDNPPIVEVYADPLEGDEPLDVEVTCALLDNAQGAPSGEGPFDYLIDFGDGDTYSVMTSDREYTRTHEYLQNGTYNITCTVTDSDGDPGFGGEYVEVYDTEPTVDLQANLVAGDEPLDVVFFCDADGYDIPLSYELDFGDGSPAVLDNGDSHVYNQSGLFSAVCTVTDADGSVVSDTIDIDVDDTAPDVSFTWSPAAPDELEDVDFDSTVTGHDGPFTLAWDFDDDGVIDSTDEDPTVQFPQEGDYNVSLTATDADGSGTTAWNLVTVGNNAPVVNLDVNTTSGLEPLSVNYTCEVGDGNGPFDYVVDFGDGVPSGTDAEGEHTYQNPGDYDMTCTVTDSDGDVDSDTVVINVGDNPPSVEITADGVLDYLEGTEGDTIDFECTITGGNEPFVTQMDFDDGTSTADLVESHTYPLEGVYNVTCDVTDHDLDVAQDSVLVNITDNAPVASLDVDPASGDEPLTVNYTCDVGGGNDPIGYVVDFGDGSPVATAAEGQHTYPNPGSYDMTCTVTDDDGDVDSDTLVVNVDDNPPVVDLIAVPVGGDEGVDIMFTCNVTEGNEPFSYLIDFDDGNTSTESSVLHTYDLEGEYNATCTVTDLDGDVGSDSELIVVGDNVPVVNLLTNVSDGVEPLSVNYTCTVGGGNEPYSYSIDFGDGSAPVSSDTASHTYAQNGTYSASCTVTDVDGDVSSDADAVTVYDTEPETNFTFSPAGPVEGDLVQFTDHTSAYDGVVAWEWDFGDGNTSAAQSPSKTYDLEGSYLVVLTTTDGDGSQTSHSEWVDVGDNVPVVNTTVTPLSGTEPLSVSITCSATGGNAPLSYEILFGDGNSTSGSSAAYTYTEDGSYPVVCQVTDTDGDVGSEIETVLVDDTVPTADFSWLPANPEAGETVSFTDLSTAYDGLAAWSWDFDGDGVEDSAEQDPNTSFASPGLYQVNLSVTDDDGSTAWIMKTIAINVSFPAPIIFNVQAQDITNVTANATWATDQAADSLVKYGTDPALFGSSVSDAALGFSHALLLSGLTPNTTYYFNVTSCNMHADCTTEGPFNFTTLPTVVDTTAPVVNLELPADGSTDTDGNVTVQYNVTDDMADPLTCDVYSDTSGAWQIDIAGQSTASGGSNMFDYTGLSDGTYTWNVECSDGANAAFAPADFTFTVSLPLPTCGDGNVDAGEECDDNNTLSGDGCSDLCVIEFCGDGILQSLVEECDDGNNASGDGCSGVCEVETIPPTCGNGVIDAGEECDGGQLGGFGCSDLDAFTGGSLACTASCTFDTTSCTGTPTGVCGDGMINPGESCDGSDWGPVTGCSDFGYAGGSLSCTASCGFDTSACTAATGQTIINSTIYGGYYLLNYEADVVETTVSGSWVEHSTVQGSPVSDILESNLTYAVLTDVSPIQNCTVIGTAAVPSTISGGSCIDVFIDPSDIVESNTTGSSITDSNVSYSNATYSTISGSTITASDIDHCTIDNSYVDGLSGFQCTITDSTVTDSTVTDSTVENGSTVADSTVTDGSAIDDSDVDGSVIDSSDIIDSNITDSTIINSTVTNSTIINSTIEDATVEDAWIEDGVIHNGTVNGVDYNNTNVTDVLNLSPVAVAGASPSSGQATLSVSFDGSGSWDPNEGSALNDSIVSYSWDFDDSDGIGVDATGVSASHDYASVGTYVATLTVTDSYGKTGSDTVTITVNTPSQNQGGSSGGGGGGGGGRTGDTFILVLTPSEPSKTLHLKSGDTVKYVSDEGDFSFMFRYIYSDKAKMGVSKETSYREYTLDEDKKYNINLDDEEAADLGVTPSGLYSGSGDFRFELLNLPDRTPIVVLPPAERESEETADQTAELEADVEEPEPEEVAYSEGVLEFVESLSVKSRAPLGAGLAVSAAILLLGLGAYFLVTRKRD